MLKLKIHQSLISFLHLTSQPSHACARHWKKEAGRKWHSVPRGTFYCRGREGEEIYPGLILGGLRQTGMGDVQNVTVSKIDKGEFGLT